MNILHWSVRNKCMLLVVLLHQNYFHRIQYSPDNSGKIRFTAEVSGKITFIVLFYFPNRDLANDLQQSQGYRTQP